MDMEHYEATARKRVRDVVLTEEIGKGSYAVVWKGIFDEDPENPQIVAIKEIDINKYKRENQIERMNKEIDIMSGLNHPNIVRYIRKYKTKNHMYLILELCEFGNLSTFLKSYSQSFVGNGIQENYAKGMILEIILGIFLNILMGPRVGVFERA